MPVSRKDPPLVDETVLTAARSVMATSGWHAVTMERIAEAAGVSRVTLHRRGITKQLILGQLAAQGLERYRAVMWPALTSEGSGAHRLELAIRALCEAAESDMHLIVALREASDDVFHDESSDGLTRTEFTVPFERILRDGATDGSLTTTDFVETATVIFNLVGWTYIHLRLGHGWSPDRALANVEAIALRGLLAR